ncbi:MAG: hypothetical protein NXH75_05620 [Halobacteriovoraceae bacterium]|nr:hypothetical protein [Halobacteriovoraceae bacterium]
MTNDEQVTSKDDEIVEKAIELSLVEVVVGSTLHNLRVPMAGHALSLNQGFLLGRFSENAKSALQKFKIVFEVSIVTALMKALSPSAKKVGPMVSISAQGFLYGLGALLGGKGKLGSILGMMLLSLWAFCQPAVTYLMIYGPDFIHVLEIMMAKVAKVIQTETESLWLVLLACIAFKWIIAIALVFVPERFSYDRFLNRIPKTKEGILLKKHHSPSMGALKDLLRPSFLLSFVMMAFFFYMSGKTVNATLWLLLRSIGIAFLIFYLARSPHFHLVVQRLALKSKTIKRFYDLALSAKAKLQGKTVSDLK